MFRTVLDEMDGAFSTCSTEQKYIHVLVQDP